jgi:Peptidase M50B-like
MDTATFGSIWHRAVAAQPLPPRTLVLACGLASLIAVASRHAWPVTRTVVTVAHEGGHALVALLTGRRLAGVRVHANTAGVTWSAGRPAGPGIVLTTAAGYLAPPLLGLGTAALLATGHLGGALMLSLVLLAGLLFVTRNAYGLLVVVMVAAAVALVLWRASSLVEGIFGYAMAWFLLFGGLRPVLELNRSRRRGRSAGSDADQLARLTGVPGGAWVLLFGAAALGALAVSALWLVK